MDTLETGNPSFEDANGLAAWEYLQEHPGLEQCFDRSMTRLTAVQCKRIITNVDFSAYKTIVDIGGGQGLLITEILNACPGLQGVLFERPSVAKRAQTYLERKRLSSRCKVVVGDFFDGITSSIKKPD